MNEPIFPTNFGKHEVIRAMGTCTVVRNGGGHLSWQNTQFDIRVGDDRRTVNAESLFQDFVRRKFSPADMAEIFNAHGLEVRTSVLSSKRTCLLKFSEGDGIYKRRPRIVTLARKEPEGDHLASGQSDKMLDGLASFLRKDLVSIGILSELQRGHGLTTEQAATLPTFNGLSEILYLMSVEFAQGAMLAQKSEDTPKADTVGVPTKKFKDACAAWNRLDTTSAGSSGAAYQNYRQLVVSIIEFQQCPQSGDSFLADLCERLTGSAGYVSLPEPTWRRRTVLDEQRTKQKSLEPVHS